MLRKHVVDETHVRSDFLEPLVGLVVEVDLARLPEILGGLEEVAKESGINRVLSLTNFFSVRLLCKNIFSRIYSIRKYLVYGN